METVADCQIWDQRWRLFYFSIKKWIAVVNLILPLITFHLLLFSKTLLHVNSYHQRWVQNYIIIIYGYKIILCLAGCVRRVQTAMLSLAGMEWYCYAALGVLTALMSFCMDLTIAKLLRGERVLVNTNHALPCCIMYSNQKNNTFFQKYIIQ